MIRQTITLNTKVILTLIHENDDFQIGKRTIDKTEMINDTLLSFNETTISGLNEVKCDLVNEGFLYQGHAKNPYSYYSTEFIEYINLDNTLVNSLASADNFELLDKISKHIKEWTGFKLKKNLYSLGNTIHYKSKSIEVNLFRIDENLSGVEVLGLNKNCTTIAKLKGFDCIKETYIKLGEKCVLNPDFDWFSVDIEVYQNEKIIYSIYDLSYIKGIQTSLSTISNIKEVNLTSFRKKIKIVNKSNSIIECGITNGDVLAKLHVEEKQLVEKCQFKNAKDLYFLGKDETEKAFEAFEDLVRIDCKEMWIFDPYFHSLNMGKDKIKDIIKILLSRIDVDKNIIFSSTKNEESIFIDKVLKGEISIITTQINNLSIKFINTDAHFHDRFFFMKDNSIITGYLIGTSLNSFGDNYSTLIKLNKYHAEYIFEKLHTEVVQGSTIEKFELKNGEIVYEHG